MINYRIIKRPAFSVLGRKTWISGQDNDLFGRFWEKCRQDDLFASFEQITHLQPGQQTGGTTLGISRVENDPALRTFDYMIAIETSEENSADDLEAYLVPASLWAVFECRGKVPDSIVASEIYAFSQWLPASGYRHANAPEMEVYLPGESGDDYLCEFWLPMRSIYPKLSFFRYFVRRSRTKYLKK